MRSIATFIVFTCAILGFHNSYALQVKTVKDNQTIFAKISSKQLSQIFVNGDRILSVRGIEGAYQLTKDESKGAIFIKPTPYFEHRTINIFILTEDGHSYTLLLNPMDIPSENIELKPLSPSKKLAEHWEKNSPYTELVMNILNDMVNQRKPEGYAVISLGKVKPKKLTSGITMQLLTLYKGSQLQGEIWKLKNDCKTTIEIEPKDFYQDDIRAISVVDEKLRAGDETILYRVVDYVGRD